MKLLINKEIVLKEWVSADDDSLSLFRKYNVFIDTGKNVVVCQKINLYNEEEFCEVIDALECCCDVFMLNRCSAFVEGYLVFIWE